MNKAIDLPGIEPGSSVSVGRQTTPTPTPSPSVTRLGLRPAKTSRTTNTLKEDDSCGSRDVGFILTSFFSTGAFLFFILGEEI